MSVLDRIAYFQGRRDEVPNQELARALAAREDRDGIGEIAANLHHSEPNVRSDCLKVLYEVGYLKPELVAPFTEEFVQLLGSRNNRMVWGAMIALSTVAGVAAGRVYPHVAEIRRAMAAGSVITVDAGVLALARVAASSDARRAALMPFLLAHLRTCRPKDVPRQAERILGALTPADSDAFLAALRDRLPQMTPAQAARVKRVIQQAEKG